MIETNVNVPFKEELLSNYFHSLVNCFFKILPIRESGESSLNTYMESLQAELIGCSSVIVGFDKDSSFLTLISILQYLIDHPSCSVKSVKREVFRAINICNRLQAKYDKAVT